VALPIFRIVQMMSRDSQLGTIPHQNSTVSRRKSQLCLLASHALENELAFISSARTIASVRNHGPYDFSGD
jgi:hypothetical protein